MGKNDRHKKKLKSERAKVQIKTKTKFLPKGQNVTNTAFKIKPIVVQEQLKERDPNSITKRKLSVPELVAKLKHFNDTIKVQACQDLKDVLKSQPFEVVQSYLSALVQNASLLLQDREKKVRRSCIKLLSQTLESIPFARLEPFCNFILTNLKCAMTNINKNIQEDSLLLLDAFLEYQPSFLAANFEKFFADFLTLISTLRNHSGLERTLSLNLGSKVSDVKWRIKVLTRLYKILKVIIESCSEEKRNLNQNAKAIFCGATGSNYIQILRDSSIYEQPAIEMFSDNDDKQKSLNINVAVLIPLLYESWLEVTPEKPVKKTDSHGVTVLTEEAFAVLSCTTKILLLMQEYAIINDESFTDDETTKFLRHLLNSFPYSYNRNGNSEFMKEFAKSFALNSDHNCVEENLVIIYLFITSLNADTKVRNKLLPLVSYVNHCLKSSNHINVTSVGPLVAVLKEFFLKRPHIWHGLCPGGVEILDNLIQFFSKGKLPESSKQDILEILTSSTLATKCEKHQEWLRKLSNFLCKDKVSAKLVDVVLNLCRQNNRTVQEGVKESLTSILDILPTMEIVDTNDEEAVRKRICYIFFYLPDLSKEELNYIHNFIENHSGLSYSKVFLNILDLRVHLGR